MAAGIPEVDGSKLGHNQLDVTSAGVSCTGTRKWMQPIEPQQASYVALCVWTGDDQAFGDVAVDLVDGVQVVATSTKPVASLPKENGEWVLFGFNSAKHASAIAVRTTGSIVQVGCGVQGNGKASSLEDSEWCNSDINIGLGVYAPSPE